MQKKKIFFILKITSIVHLPSPLPSSFSFFIEEYSSLEIFLKENYIYMQIKVRKMKILSSWKKMRRKKAKKKVNEKVLK